MGIELFELARWGTVFVGLMIGAYYDHRTGKIPNFITYPLLFFGFLSVVFAGQWLNLLLGLVLLLGTPFIKSFGMGDTKALTATQWLIGWHLGFPIIFFIIPITLLFSILTKQRRLGPIIYVTFSFFFFGKILF